MIKKMSFALTALLIPSLLLAEPNKHEQHLGHKAHVHGIAEVTLAAEGITLEILLESPASNLTGFEHSATTQDEIRAIKRTESLLKSSSLFLFTGTDCELKEVTVDIPAALEKDNDEHENHAHSEGHHEEQHTNSESHSEIIASYYFSCSNAEGLSSVSIALFEKFPGMEKIKAQWVTQTQQGAASLTAKTSTIFLR